MSRLGQPSRTEDVAASEGQPRQLFLEWDRRSQHTVIVVDPAAGDIQTILFTERGTRCTTWAGVPVGKATVEQLFKLRGNQWTRRHYGCDDGYLRLVFTYPEDVATMIEFTAFIPKASAGALASQLCKQADETPTDRSIALLNRKVDRLQKIARRTRIRAVAIRRATEPHDTGSTDHR